MSDEPESPIRPFRFPHEAFTFIPTTAYGLLCDFRKHLPVPPDVAGETLLLLAHYPTHTIRVTWDGVVTVGAPEK